MNVFSSELLMTSGTRLLAGVVVASMCARGALAQTATPISTPNPLGVWRGTSVCLVRPSSCNDESVVYRITLLAARDSVSVDARKMVNGREEEMGVLGCGLEPSRVRLTCTMRNGVWRFTVRDDSLIGELRLPNDVKFRDVRAARSR
jgi:hypothetical protein